MKFNPSSRRGVIENVVQLDDEKSTVDIVETEYCEMLFQLKTEHSD